MTKDGVRDFIAAEYTLSENYVHGLAAFGPRLKKFESPHSSRGSSPGLPAGNSVIVFLIRAKALTDFVAETAQCMVRTPVKSSYVKVVLIDVHCPGDAADFKEIDHSVKGGDDFADGVTENPVGLHRYPACCDAKASEFCRIIRIVVAENGFGLVVDAFPAGFTFFGDGLVVIGFLLEKAKEFVFLFGIHGLHEGFGVSRGYRDVMPLSAELFDHAADFLVGVPHDGNERERSGRGDAHGAHQRFCRFCHC